MGRSGADAAMAKRQKRNVEYYIRECQVCVHPFRTKRRCIENIYDVL